MQVILLRHGKAQDPASAPADAERALTPEGERVLQAASHGLVKVLSKKRELRIWTSPLLRARQTAAIVAAALSIPEVQEKEEIAHGKLEPLARAWQQLPPRTCLLLVGHEPHLSQWGARLSGCVLPMQTAAAACFEISTAWPPQGHLLWFAQAAALDF